MRRHHAGSNIFEVTDIDALREALSGLDVELYEADVNKVYLESLSDDGDWPAPTPGPDSTPLDFFERVSIFLADQAVAMFYLCGYDSVFCQPIGLAIAVNNKGQRRTIDIRDIENLAHDLGNKIEDFS